MGAGHHRGVPDPTSPERRKLSTARIVFLVVAAAAPLAAMVGNVPLALKLGNGPGLPGAFVLATVVLLCFAVGYAAMSRKIVNTGAFYTYVARGSASRRRGSLPRCLFRPDRYRRQRCANSKPC